MFNGLKAILRIYVPVVGLLALLPFAVQANEITYYIDAYAHPGYSASWVHSADDCVDRASDFDMDGTQGPDQLCMSGNRILPLAGEIVGQWDNGSFAVSGGNLASIDILDGNLGGAFADGHGNPLWFLELDLGDLGDDDTPSSIFYFENLYELFGGDTGYPNYIGANHLVLWGQNLDAYRGCDDSDSEDGCSPLGVDIYARIPEPATLLLLSMGLLLVGSAARRRTTI